MRIISGLYKGRRFTGKAPVGVRPTQDAMRETVFNVLYNFMDVESAVVADICAGTGAMAIEAISRGAEFAYFVDNSKASINYQRAALDNFRVEKSKYKIVMSDALKFLKAVAASNENVKFDLIFTDPPYSLNIVNDMLKIIEEKELLNPGGMFVAEVGDTSFLVPPTKLSLVAEKNYTAAKVLFFLNETDNDEIDA